MTGRGIRFTGTASGIAAALALLSLGAGAAMADDDDIGGGIGDVEQVVVLIEGTVPANGAAFASGYLNMSIVGNTVTEHGTIQTNFLLGSVNGGEGIVGINQDAGNLSNQVNAVAISVIETDAVVAGASLEGSIYLGDNTFNVSNASGLNVIDGSFNGFSGIASVNQSVGNMNQQANAVVMAIGLGATDIVSVGDVDLGTVIAADNVDNIDPDTTDYDNRISNSFNNFSGIAQVNQVAGNGNISTKVVGISVNVSSLPLGGAP
ncbi:MAG: hypothetical protein QNJ30_17010 [Kiloniellales bacterium]|nr:hypothetical protein [Kiloniellales bacterium]